MKIPYSKKIKSGYSVLELIIYIALFAILSIVLVRSLITVMRTYATSSNYRALQNNGELIMERITREIRSGSSVSNVSACPLFSQSIKVNGLDAEENEQTVSFTLVDGVISLTANGENNPVSTNRVLVTQLSLCSFSTTTSTGIKTKLSLTTLGSNPISADFYSTIMMRGH